MADHRPHPQLKCNYPCPARGGSCRLAAACGFKGRREGGRERLSIRHSATLTRKRNKRPTRRKRAPSPRGGGEKGGREAEADDEMNLSSSRAMSRVIGEESGKRERERGREWRRVENEQEEGQFLRTRRRRRRMSRQEGEGGAHTVQRLWWTERLIVSRDRRGTIEIPRGMP